MADKIIAESDVIDEAYSSITNEPPSANQIKLVNERIDNLNPSGDVLIHRAVDYNAGSTAIVYNFGDVSVLWNTTNKQFQFRIQSPGFIAANGASTDSEVSIGPPPKIQAIEGGTFTPVLNTNYYFTQNGGFSPVISLTNLSNTARQRLVIKSANQIGYLQISAMVGGTNIGTDAWVAVDLVYSSNNIGSLYTVNLEFDGNLTMGQFDLTQAPQDSGILMVGTGQLISATSVYSSDSVIPASTSGAEVYINGASTGQIIDIGVPASSTRSVTKIFDPPIPFGQATLVNLYTTQTTTDFLSTQIYLVFEVID